MTKRYKIIPRFLVQLVGMISLYRNYQEVINLLFVLPFGLYLNIFRTEEILQFWGKKFSTCVARLSSARGNLAAFQMSKLYNFVSVFLFQFFSLASSPITNIIFPNPADLVHTFLHTRLRSVFLENGGDSFSVPTTLIVLSIQNLVHLRVDLKPSFYGF